MITIMPKLLPAVRLDDSDEHVSVRAGREGRRVGRHRRLCGVRFRQRAALRPACHCDARSSRSNRARAARSPRSSRSGTPTSTAQADALAWYLVRNWGAPSWEDARRVAGDEVRHTAEVCETLAPEVWITVKREPSATAPSCGAILGV
jgi:hypothetical protein